MRSDRPQYVLKAADLSECGQYRYTLHRQWVQTESPKRLLFVMLNPSSANGLLDDPTVGKCVGFAQRLGYDALSIGNLYAWRSPYPKALMKAADPVSPDNDAWLTALVRNCDRAIAAWGNSARVLGPVWREREAAVIDLLTREKHLYRLGSLTVDGNPRHPLYLKYDTEPVVWIPHPDPIENHLEP